MSELSYGIHIERHQYILVELMPWIVRLPLLSSLFDFFEKQKRNTTNTEVNYRIRTIYVVVRTRHNRMY
jgi:hypothetical protein